MDATHDVAVVGAGLAAGVAAARAGARVVVVDGHPPGGRARTDDRRDHSGSAAGLAPAGGAVVHLMRYGARDAATDRAELWALARVAGIGEDDVIEQRFLAHMVVTHAVPVPGSGRAGRPGVASAGVDGVYVAGDWVGPDGLLGDAALASGQRTGLAAAAHARTAVAA